MFLSPYLALYQGDTSQDNKQRRCRHKHVNLVGAQPNEWLIYNLAERPHDNTTAHRPMDFRVRPVVLVYSIVCIMNRVST